ncbi:MAG: hypothetical protein WD607_02350 [Candidatus Paceibacterota bacterium]
MSGFVRIPTSPDHTGMKERQYIQELIDDFLKGRLDNWEQVVLLEFIATMAGLLYYRIGFIQLLFRSQNLNYSVKKLI